MDKVDVLKIVRANDEKFKMHLDKLSRLEEKEKRINEKVIKAVKDDGRLHKDNQENKDSNYVYNQLFNSIENDYDEKKEITTTTKPRDIDNANQLRLDKNKGIIENKDKTSSNNENRITKEKNSVKFSPKENDINKVIRTHQYNDSENNDKAMKYTDNNSNQGNVSDKNTQINHSHLDKKNKEKDKSAKTPHLKNTQTDDISIVKDHYAYSDSSNNQSEGNQEKEVDYKPQSIDLLSAPEDSSDINKNAIPIKPTHLKNFNLKCPIKSNLPQTINAAINDNEAKRPYTAYTYSTIQKIKTTPKPKKKPGIFQKAMKKKYKGKTDKVALYQMHQNDWSKKSYLNK